jgi:hypothetical protein
LRLVQYPKPRPQLLRAEAARLLSRVVVRASEINLDPVRFPFAVRRLLVFGSYLTDRGILGDLDIGVELLLVRPASDLADERPEWRLIHWANRTHVALQVRKPKLVSIHDISEVFRLDIPTREVFDDDRLQSPPVEHFG